MKIRHPDTGQVIEVEGEPTEAELDSMFTEQPKIEKRDAQDTKVKDAYDISETLFPRSTIAMKAPTGMLRKAGALGMDLSAMLTTAPTAWGRSVESMGGTGVPFLEGYKQISEGKGPTGEPNFLSKLMGDPATVPSVATGTALGGWVLKGGKWLPTLAKGERAAGALLKGTGAAAAEGVVSAGVHQADSEDPSLKEFGKEVGISAAVPAAVGLPFKVMNKSLGVLASQLSNVSEETIRKWGTGFGKGAKELKAIHGKQNEIGKKILHSLDNFEEFTPEKKIIDEALGNMGNVSMSKTVSTIENIIKKYPNPNTNKKAISALNDLLKDAKLKGNELSASDFKKFRGTIDDIVEWGKPGAKNLNKSLKDIRTSMKDELVDVADATGNPEYKPLMEGWADKLQKRDALLEEIGANAKTRNKRIGVFMSTLFNKNKEVRQKALGDMTDIFGEDFVKQAKLLQMSDAMLMSGGKVSKILPNRETGAQATGLIAASAGTGLARYFESPKTMAAAILLAAESSPMVASKTLTVAELAEWMAKQPAQLGARQKAQE